MDSITLENFINYCDEMMIAEESKIVKTEQKKIGNKTYIVEILDLTIDGVHIVKYLKTVNLNDKNEKEINVKLPKDVYDPSNKPTVDEAFNAMKKEFSKIKLSIAEDLMDYIRTCIKNGDVGLEKRFEKIKDAKELIPVIKPQGDFSFDIHYGSRGPIGIFRLSYDTNPYIDNNHVYTKYVEYNYKTKTLTYDYNEYDG